MQDESLKIVVSGLMHDIGKIVYRTGDGRQHSLTGMEFLRDEAGIHDKSILEAVRYHHGAELRGAHIPNDSPAYIIYIADNIASASDRRKSDGKESGFDRQVPLESIFNILNGNHGNKHYHPEALDESKKANMPTDKPIVYDSSFYTHTRNALLDTLKGVDVLDRSYIHSLLETMEAHTSFIPSSTAIHELADISLFDHSKMTAAMASCIYEYLEERKERDYKSRLFERAKDFYDEKAFQLVSMDISGIQKFIYTIHSKNALKMLRGRSFYLEILMEHMIDELLEAMDLTRANLIYSGGGHCYILAPNTEAARNMIVGKNKEFNDFFLKQFDVALYVASAYVPCSAHELENTPEGTYAPLFRTLSEQLSEQKMKRYSSSQIMELNRRSYGEGRRECRVCKTSSNLNEEGICQFCRSMESLSSKVLYAECFSVFAREDSRKIPLPCGKTLFAQSEEELRKWLAKEYMPTKPKETALRKTLQLLKELFRYGISQKLCSSNPAEYILFDDYVKDCDHSKKTAEERAFSEEELAILWEDALKTPTKPRALMTLLAMETGLRAGELAALHISDIQDDFIHVHRQQLRDTATGHQLFHFVDYTKDERKHPHDGRYVPITSACAKVLELARQLPGNSKYLFHDKAGNAISKDSYEQNLRRRCARLGIETHHNHAFRVAFNSRLIEMGFSPAERAYILGHAVETNERNYSVTDTRRRYDMRDRIREQEKKSNEQGKKSEKMVEVSNDFHRMASQKGFEPPTSPLGGARSIQLSY